MNLTLKRTPGLFLVGFMGSGKSTIGRALAGQLGWPFVDLDDDIEATALAPITRIFAEQGEDEFRRIESAALRARLDQVRAGRPLVVALGGGAFVQPRNQELLRGNGISLWLDCPLDCIERRIAGQTHRPLARDPEAFRRLFENRRNAYAQADYTVPVVDDDPQVTVRRILEIPGLF